MFFFSDDKESDKCKQFEKVWHSINSEILTTPEFLKDSHHHQITKIFPSITDAIFWCQRRQSENIPPEKSWNYRPIPRVLREATHVQVLITGSIHLVGGVLTLLKVDENH